MPKKRSSTKSRIIKAAWNLFYKHGYEQTTVDEIISASKTSKGTFYHYFKGKEALLNTLSYLFDEKYEELAGIVDPDLSAYDKLLFFNHELFHMIETSVDVGLLASLYSSQLITKDKMTPRHLTIVSVALGVGYGMGANSGILAQAPQALQLICGESGIVPAAFVAILLNVLLPKNDMAE